MHPLIITQHSSGFVPFDILAQMLGPDVYDATKRARRLKTINYSGDLYTDMIYFVPGAEHAPALTSRFVVDLNRKRDAVGDNGVVKLTTFEGEPLYLADFKLSDKERERRLEHYYDPFHRALDVRLAHPEVGFFVDGHAMSFRGPAIGPDAGKLRPAFCVMNAGDKEGKAASKHVSVDANRAGHVAELLAKHFRDVIRDSDVPDDILLNDPFPSGGTIDRLSDPAREGSKPGFGLEFNSNLYLAKADEPGVSHIPGRLRLLNERFRAFIREASKLFM